MKFNVINDCYQQSECGRYRISKVRDGGVRDGVIYTLTYCGLAVHQEKCNNIASERTQAINNIKDKVEELE